MADLYLERIGLVNPTIVKRDNNGKIERLESRGLDMASLVAFWRRCFDLNGHLIKSLKTKAASVSEIWNTVNSNLRRGNYLLRLGRETAIRVTK